MRITVGFTLLLLWRWCSWRTNQRQDKGIHEYFGWWSELCKRKIYKSSIVHQFRYLIGWTEEGGVEVAQV